MNMWPCLDLKLWTEINALLIPLILFLIPLHSSSEFLFLRVRKHWLLLVTSGDYATYVSMLDAQVHSNRTSTLTITVYRICSKLPKHWGNIWHLWKCLINQEASWVIRWATHSKNSNEYDWCKFNHGVHAMQLLSAKQQACHIIASKIRQTHWTEQIHWICHAQDNTGNLSYEDIWMYLQNGASW